MVLVISACSNDCPDSACAVVQTQIATPTSIPTNTPTNTPVSTSTFRPTSTPTITPTTTPTSEPTNTPPAKPTSTPCIVQIREDGDSVPYEHQTDGCKIEVFTQWVETERPASIRVIQLDEETLGVGWTQYLNNGWPNGGYRWGELDVNVHLNSNSGQNGLPVGLEFGLNEGTFLLDVTLSTSADLALYDMLADDYIFASGKRFFVELPVYSIVELLVETFPSESERNQARYFFTITDSGDWLWLTSLNYNIEQSGFERSGVSFYVGSIGCGEGGSCLDVATHRKGISIISEGNSGRYMTIPHENAYVYIEGIGNIGTTYVPLPEDVVSR